MKQEGITFTMCEGHTIIDCLYKYFNFDILYFSTGSCIYNKSLITNHASKTVQVTKGDVTHRHSHLRYCILFTQYMIEMFDLKLRFLHIGLLCNVFNTALNTTKIVRIKRTPQFMQFAKDV